ncbi:hypothetical protein ACWGOQ_0021800 [Aquimarina sp. M1]
MYKINTSNAVSLGAFLGVNTIRDTAAPIVGSMVSYRYERLVFSYLFQSTYIDTEEVQGERRSISIGSHKIGITYQLF